MKHITVARAVSWLAVVLTGWSLNIRWGTDLRVRAAAPPQFERHVVGAMLLLLIAAVALFFIGKKPRGKAALTALACALGAHGIAWWVRALAAGSGQGHLTAGSGWLWMVTGTALAIAAAASVLLIKAPTPKGKRS